GMALGDHALAGDRGDEIAVGGFHQSPQRGSRAPGAAPGDEERPLGLREQRVRGRERSGRGRWRAAAARKAHWAQRRRFGEPAERAGAKPAVWPGHTRAWRSGATSSARCSAIVGTRGMPHTVSTPLDAGGSPTYRPTLQGAELMRVKG